MRIEFSAFADDYTVRGDVALDGERIVELLEAAPDIEVGTLRLRALDDGRELELPSATIRREELCVVVATGPRGRTDRRFRTRSHPMRVTLGPYTVVGYFQTLPTADPWTMLQRRQVVALSPARISFVVAGERVEETHDALLLLRDKIESLDYASDDDVNVARSIDAPVLAEALSKAPTVDVHWLRRDR